jgi:hypothetical protein
VLKLESHCDFQHGIGIAVGYENSILKSRCGVATMTPEIWEKAGAQAKATTVATKAIQIDTERGENLECMVESVIVMCFSFADL